LHSDEKRVTKNGKELYPIYITLGNFNKQARKKTRARRVIAYIPCIQTTLQNKNNPQHRMKVMLLHQKCFEKILAPFKENELKFLS